MTDIIEEIGKLFFKIIFECILIWTGELILYSVTWGNHKPRWDMYLNDTPKKYVISEDDYKLHLREKYL